jgi:hypothetical protein
VLEGGPARLEEQGTLLLIADRTPLGMFLYSDSEFIPVSKSIPAAVFQDLQNQTHSTLSATPAIATQLLALRPPFHGLPSGLWGTEYSSAPSLAFCVNTWIKICYIKFQLYNMGGP